nr:MAG TPA: hypothetical protein [Caudoviricetes sp.]
MNRWDEFYYILGLTTGVKCATLFTSRAIKP